MLIAFATALSNLMAIAATRESDSHNDQLHKSAGAKSHTQATQSEALSLSKAEDGLLS
ncbi:hypothetical protein [Shewanella zhangzhouensis]|uniref:hypothetical protein n=1 Tax=Shewanella zhangzhouensis TaxID=2864213 RepID=UPI001C65B1C1|nr:hypothetical protein [Shewanella zhangzhouensis]QYK04810.1 hypothetical protein K0H63_17445 [Shewanella zhangzhouensis]